MSSQEFQAAYTSIYNTGTFLLKYLQEFRDGLRIQGDESQGLQSIEDEINQALKALQDQKYQVAVIAAMKNSPSRWWQRYQTGNTNISLNPFKKGMTWFGNHRMVLSKEVMVN